MRLELAILGMRGSVDVRLTEITGALALLNQRSEAADRRADEREKAHEERMTELAKRITTVDERLDIVERTAVTKTDLDNKGKRTVSVVAVIVSVAGLIITTIFGLITITTGGS